jgi:S1-C subfamily serine protease
MGGPDKDGAEGPGDDAETPLRGWIDPDDRLWRHPSEMAGSLHRGPVSAFPTPVDGPHHSPLMLLVGAVGAIAAVAWIVILLSPASDRPPRTSIADVAADAPLTTLAAHGPGIPSAATAASQSIVALRAETDHGTVDLVGVAVAEGGLVATPASGLVGLRSLSMVGAGGRLMRSSVVGLDPTSGLALVNVPDDVPVAPFADDGALNVGTADMTLTMSTPSAGSPALHCTPGTISSIGQPLKDGSAVGMPAINSSATDGAEVLGDPLLNAQGDVIGILYSTGSGDDDADGATPATTPAFLPSQLVLGVSDDLRSKQHVTHGWLGVEGPDTDTTEGLGAQVTSVMSGSPAVGRLQPGEIIVGVGTLPVRTMAELKARLYVLAPASTVALSVIDGTVTRIVDVTLSASP